MNKLWYEQKTGEKGHGLIMHDGEFTWPVKKKKKKYSPRTEKKKQQNK